MKLGVPCLDFTYSMVRNKRRLNETLQTKDMHGDASKNMDDFFYYLRNSFHFLKRQFQGASFNQIDVYWF
jgi:hypothetical protein